MTVKEAASNEEYMYCQVQFRNIQRTYFYISDDDTICVGDFVSVPFGKDNIETIGKVRSVAVHSSGHTPYPPHLTKHIIGKAEKPEEWSEKDIKLERTQEYQPIDPSSVTSGLYSNAPGPVVWEATEIEQTDLQENPYDKHLKNYIAKTQKPKKYSTRFKAITILTALVILIGAVSMHHFVRDYKYDAALAELNAGHFSEAGEQFESIGSYRDAEALYIFCKYTDVYKTAVTYEGGESELAGISLEYEKRFQKDVDTLEERVSVLAEEKRIADEEAREQQLAAEEADKKAIYGNDIPVEGMPISCLKYTLLGAPDKTEKCEDYDKLEGEHKRKSLYWYDDEGNLMAVGICFKLENDTEEMLYGFDYYGDAVHTDSDDENREWIINNN